LLLPTASRPKYNASANESESFVHVHTCICRSSVPITQESILTDSADKCRVQLKLCTEPVIAAGGGDTALHSAKSAPRFSCVDCHRSYSTFSGLTKHRQFHCASQVRARTRAHTHGCDS
jgi:hypothetical protein